MSGLPSSFKSCPAGLSTVVAKLLYSLNFALRRTKSTRQVCATQTSAMSLLTHASVPLLPSTFPLLLDLLGTA